MSYFRIHSVPPGSSVAIDKWVVHRRRTECDDLADTANKLADVSGMEVMADVAVVLHAMVQRMDNFR